MNAEAKILIIGALPPPWHGVTVYNDNLLHSRVNTCFTLIHLDTSDQRGLDNLGRFDFVNVYLGIKNCLQEIILLCKERPKIVYLSIAQNKAYLRDGLFILIARLFSRAKIIIHNHGIFKDYYDRTNIFMRLFIDVTLRCADKIIVLAECLRYTVKRWVKDIIVVPNGVNMDCPAAARRAPGKGWTVIYMSNFFIKKGIIDALEAARIVVKQHPDVKFKFAGNWWQQEPETKDYALRLIKENRLEGNVEFIGFVAGEEKRQFLLNGDIFIFPSHYDAFPLVVIEAMAAGCAIVATAVGALPEVIIDGQTGILIEKQNPGKLAEAINYFVNHPAAMKDMGAKARRRYEDKYRLDENISRLIGVFNDSL